MYKAFPCSDYYGQLRCLVEYSEPLLIAVLRHFDLGNLQFSTHDNYWRDRLSDATFILISAYCGYAMTSSCHAHTKNWAWCHGMA